MGPCLDEIIVQLLLPHCSALLPILLFIICFFILSFYFFGAKDASCALTSETFLIDAMCSLNLMPSLRNILKLTDPRMFFGRGRCGFDFAAIGFDFAAIFIHNEFSRPFLYLDFWTLFDRMLAFFWPPLDPFGSHWTLFLPPIWLPRPPPG